MSVTLELPGICRDPGTYRRLEHLVPAAERRRPAPSTHVLPMKWQELTVNLTAASLGAPDASVNVGQVSP